jgi:hypothetical protein
MMATAWASIGPKIDTGAEKAKDSVEHLDEGDR